MPFVGQWEILLLVGILVLVFGTSQIPRIGRQLGRSTRQYKETLEEIDPRRPLRELTSPLEPADEPRTSRPPQPPSA